MALTPRSIVLRLLKMSGIVTTNPTHEANALMTRGVIAGDMEEALITLNAALQEVCAEGPSALTEKPISEVLRPPAQITLNATQYSKTVSAVTGWASWMKGCTVRIQGDAQDNRLLSETELQSPFMGNTGTGTGATVYGDTLPLPSNYLNIIGPIELPDRRLVLVPDPSAYRDLQKRDNTGLVTYESYGSFQNKMMGTPEIAFVDADYNAALTYLPIYLRVNPMPDRAYPIGFRVKCKPTLFTMADIEEGDYTTDPGSTIPLEWTESVLLPVALQRWTAHPSCVIDPRQSAEILRQYNQAILFLQSLRPTTGSVTATFI